ncbi:uncharacterized protein LOC119361001 [Triticum dicoccoides]|uniref:uncharacterized protein LOC119361001 n=1 Tax=Triticum dicoccoides TaxID=85692 RepID=UPI00188F92DD|nr:uncharacterized protein LOC119361001 [Triticum dicoccoides]
MPDLATHRDGVAFAFTASTCHGAVRLRASGRRTLAADLHEHQLFVHLVLDRGGRRVLMGNKGGSAAEFLGMEPRRRAEAVARIVARARLPPECAEAVERLCVASAACGRENACDDVTVAVVWKPRAGVGTGDAAGANLPSHASSSALRFSNLTWLLGYS